MFKSKSIKAGIQKSFESGISKIADKICYGYSKNPDGSLAINENEAQIVRFIFDRYLTGSSLWKIAVQARKARRSNLETTESGSQRKATKYNSGNVLSGLLI